jgi:tRNA (mo5U34)-methyltransferase
MPRRTPGSDARFAPDPTRAELTKWCTARIATRLRKPTKDEAQAFIAGSRFVWHQRFELAPGVDTPGAHKIDDLFEVGGVPIDLRGRSVLDIGTSNGGAAFVMERRGAERVVALDIYPPDWFGFDRLREFLGSQVEYVQGTVYDLGRVVEPESFDYVLFWGVLYHLRHPLLALDQVRAAMAPGGSVDIETAVVDGAHDGVPYARFYRGVELAEDPTNWFVPTLACLDDWCTSSGLEPQRVATWGEEAGKRALVVAQRSSGDPEFARISYEVALRAEPADRESGG